MVSQWSLKGTARPTHYHILQNGPNPNEPSIPKEKIEQLLFDLCFLYQRATKVVSRPAPVYYAHRAAFLAQYYESGYREMGDYFDTASTASAGSNGSGGSRDLPVISLLEKTARTIYFA